MASDADLTQTFTLNLATNAGSVATSAAKSLQELGERLKADEGALKNMQAAWKRLNAAGTVNIQTARALQERMVAQKNTIAETQDAILRLGGNFNAVKNQTSELRAALEGLSAGLRSVSTLTQSEMKTQLAEQGKAAAALGDALKSLSVSAEKPKDSVAQLVEQLRSMPGPADRLANKISAIKDILGSTATKSLVLRAAFIALGAAAAFALAKVAAFGVEVADERRSELLSLEGLTKTRFGLYGLGSAYGLVADSASFLQSNIDRVSASVAIGRDQVAQYARSFEAMGLRGGNLQEALEGVSIAASAAGERGAQQFQSMALGAAMMGKSIKAVTDDVRARFGPIVRAQMLSLTVQAAKVRENVKLIFGGLKIDKLLESISAVTSLLSQQTATGRALKEIMRVAFQPMIDAFTWLGPVAKRVFQGMVIGALLLQIGYLKVRNALRDTFGGDLISRLDMTWVYVGIGVGLAFSLAGAFAYLAVTVISALAPLLLVGAAIGAVVFAGYQLFRLWQEIDWSELGTAIGKGIIKGLKSIGGLVYDSVTGLAKGAWNAFAGFWGIKSPATRGVFGGRMIGSGLGIGMHQMVGAVAGASARLGGAAGAGLGIGYAASEGGAASAGAGVRAGGSGGARVQIGDVHVHTQATDAHGTALAVRHEMIRVFEGAGIHLGVAAA